MKINYIKIDEEKALINEITNSVVQEKVVAIFNGRMEFGPRALGSSCIIGIQDLLKCKRQ